VRRGDPGVHGDRLHVPVQLLLPHLVQLGAQHHPPVREEAEFTGDGGGGGRVVPGDHDGADAGARAGGDRVPGLRAWRIDHPDEPEQRQLVLGGPGFGVAAHGDGEDPQGLGGEIVGDGEQRVPDIVVERDDPV